MTLKIHSNISHGELLNIARDDLVEYFNRYKEKPILFLTSGGSALELISKQSAPSGLKLTLGVLDERFSSDPRVNNFSQLMQTQFYKSCIEQGYEIFDTRVSEGETLQDLEEKMNKNIQSWLQANQNGVVIITQGMGPDGHTAGVFPDKNIQRFKERFLSPAKLVVGYNAGSETTSQPERVTVTLSFLQFFVSHSICFITGEQKKKAFLEYAKSHDFNLHPFLIIRDMKDVSVYTDISN